MGRMIGRLFAVPFGFVVAMLVALGVLAYFGQERMFGTLPGADLDHMFELFERLLGLLKEIFKVETLMLPLALVIAGEVAGFRNPIYYVGAGGLAGGIIPKLAWFGYANVLGANSELWPVFASAGFAGGFVYWLIAGRGAGLKV